MDYIFGFKDPTDVPDKMSQSSPCWSKTQSSHCPISNAQDYQALLRLGPLDFLFHSADVPRAVPQVPFGAGDEGGRSPDLQKHMAVPRKKTYFV